ncbi:MAG TPA: hypothetical protein VG939_09990 [Caulobacteraceae bacterium]|nr:hypothetical protein [Caulobacteraceae bacterium]
MPGHYSTLGPGGATLIPILVAAAVILLRNSRARKLKIERLWLFPLIYLALLASMLYAAPPPLTPVSLGTLALALALGAALGWQRGRLMRIEIDPATHEMTSQASVVGIAFILVLMLVRQFGAAYLQQNAALVGLPFYVVTDALMMFVVAMLSTQRVEIWMRATRMLAEARAAKVAVESGTQPPIVS